MPQYKGNAIVKNAEGTLRINGLAVLTNDTNSITWEDVTPIQEFMDAGNVLRTVTKDMNRFQLQVEFTPGVGSALANQSAVLAAIANPRKFMQFISGSFEDSDFIVPDADKAVIVGVRKTSAQGEPLRVSLTIEKYTDTAGAVIDLTGAWTTL